MSKAIKEAVDAAKTTLNTFKGHLVDLKEIGDPSQKVGETVSNNQGVKPADEELKKAYKALTGIVTVATKEGVPNIVVGKTTLEATNKNGAQILATGSTGKPSGAVGGQAAAILSTVSGAEMLAEIVNSKEGDEQLTQNAKADTTAMSFARGHNGSGDYLAQQAAKAGAVAGGIALRSLVKTGKLASHASNDNTAVQAVGIDAVNKLLGAVENIIKKTVKKDSKECS